MKAKSLSEHTMSTMTIKRLQGVKHTLETQLWHHFHCESSNLRPSEMYYTKEDVEVICVDP